MYKPIAVMLLVVPLAAAAQLSPLKTGAWEMTHKSAAMPRPFVEKSCVTKSDIAELTHGPDKDDDDGCKNVKAPTVSGKTWSVDRACSDGRKLHAEFTAESPDRVKGLITSTAPKGGGQGISVEISGRWLGASCAGIQ